MFARFAQHCLMHLLENNVVSSTFMLVSARPVGSTLRYGLESMYGPGINY